MLPENANFDQNEAQRLLAALGESSDTAVTGEGLGELRQDVTLVMAALKSAVEIDGLSSVRKAAAERQAIRAMRAYMLSPDVATTVATTTQAKTGFWNYARVPAAAAAVLVICFVAYTTLRDFQPSKTNQTASGQSSPRNNSLVRAPGAGEGSAPAPFIEIGGGNNSNNQSPSAPDNGTDGLLGGYNGEAVTGEAMASLFVEDNVEANGFASALSHDLFALQALSAAWSDAGP